VIILSCLAVGIGAGACGSSKSSSSSTSSPSSSSASTSAASASSATSSSTSAAAPTASGGRCDQLMASSIPPVKPGSTPKLSGLEAKALQGLHTTAFRFTGQTCIATTSPAQVITLSGVASLHPDLVVDGHENIAGRALEVRFIGSKIYIYLAEIASRDGGKPWLAANLDNLSSASGLNFTELLNQIRQLSPGGPSPLFKTSAFRAEGRATVEGQTAYVYQGSFSPTDLTKLGLPGQLGKQTADKLRQLGATREQVTTYINSRAVALRTVAAIYKGSKLLTVSINSSARLSHTVRVSPPPASKTIAYSKVAG
jgi:hypothetical protein